MFQTLKQQCGRRRSEVRLVLVTESAPASISLNISPPLCVGTHTLSLSVFMTQRPHGQESPSCGHSLRNCHPLMMTSGDIR